VSLRVLCIDDDARLYELLRDYFAPNGIALVHAPDGAKGLAAVAADVFDAVLLDVMMPGMDGWEVARVIKNHPDFGAVRIVMLTARSDFTDKQQGLRSGADDYIVKPIRLEDLGSRVARNLKALERPA
jgi:two-component system OmpR family response regulator